jgi:hypothetical protein
MNMEAMKTLVFGIMDYKNKNPDPRQMTNHMSAFIERPYSAPL